MLNREVGLRGVGETRAPLAFAHRAEGGRNPPGLRERGLGLVAIAEEIGERPASVAGRGVEQHARGGIFAGEPPGRLVHEEVADERGIIGSLFELLGVLGGVFGEAGVEHIWEIAEDGGRVAEVVIERPHVGETGVPGDLPVRPVRHRVEAEAAKLGQRDLRPP